MQKLAFVCGAAALLLGSAMTATRAQDTDARARAQVTVKEVMEKTITPATNALWNVADSPTDEQWAALEEAAVTLLVAANAVGEGGAGPMDSLWARDPAWQAYNRVLIAAGTAALAAVRARDVPALVSAGDVLYPPCEGCHKQFNPALTDTE
jgi:cytochrome c556